MDYVMEPGYSSNRSYQILENANQLNDEREQIFEAMRSCGLDAEKAQLYTDTFTSPYLAAAAAGEREAELMESTQILESRLFELEAELEEARLAGETRKTRLAEWAKDYHVVVPKHVLEAVDSGDVAKEVAFFESVARVNRDKTNALPFGGGKFVGESVPAPKFGKPEVPGYGSAESAPMFD
jgi:triphosphoribosyl-dephospho-CoA synthetase